MKRTFTTRAVKAAVSVAPECGAIVCLLAVLWLGIWATLDDQRESALEGAARDTANLAHAFEESTSRIIAGADQVLLALRAAYTRDGPSFDLKRWSGREIPRDWLNAQIAIVEADGMSLASTAAPGRVYVGNREHFTTQRDSDRDQLFISKPVLGRSSGRWTIQLTRKILTPAGGFGGIVVFSVDCYYLSGFYQSLNLQQGYLLLAGLDGVIRARGPVADGAIGAQLEPLVREGLLHPVGTIRVPGGRDTVSLSYRRLQRYPLVVMVAFSDDEVLATYRNTRLKMQLAGAIATVVLLVIGTVWVMQRERSIRSQRALAITLENMNQGLVMVDANKRVRVVNNRAVELLGLPATMLASLRSSHSRSQREGERALRQALAARPDPAGRSEQNDIPADRLMVEANRSVIPGGGEVHVLTDVTARHLADQRIRRMAMHDHLTGLGNRVLFAEEADRRLAASGGTGAEFAMLCLDLDRFKRVNDTFGYDTGDELLKQVADRLQQAVGPADLVARIGGDEFAVLSSCRGQPASGQALAARILAAFKDPFPIAGQHLLACACVGIAVYPQHGSSRTELAKNADLALYAAKQDRAKPIRVFEPKMAQVLQDRLQLEEDLRAAIATDQIYAEYQPVFAVSSLAVVGFEALARWHHPTRGRIGPDLFIPLAEETGLIIPLGRKILEQACGTALAWPDRIRIAVNLSPVHFREPRLLATIADTMSTTGLATNRLELEVTEGVLIGDEERALDTLTALRALGVYLALDDFGTGYASLSYLRKFPFGRVKIDRSFVQAQVHDKRARYIVEALLGLGRNLGLEVVAEGVETRRQLHLLRQQGCHDVQGFLVGRPMPASEAVKLVPKRPLAEPSPRPVPLNTYAMTGL